MFENIRQKCYGKLETVSHDFPKMSIDLQKTAEGSQNPVNTDLERSLPIVTSQRAVDLCIFADLLNSKVRS